MCEYTCAFIKISQFQWSWNESCQMNHTLLLVLLLNDALWSKAKWFISLLAPFGLLMKEVKLWTKNSNIFYMLLQFVKEYTQYNTHRHSITELLLMLLNTCSHLMYSRMEMVMMMMMIKSHGLCKGQYLFLIQLRPLCYMITLTIPKTWFNVFDVWYSFLFLLHHYISLKMYFANAKPWHISIFCRFRGLNILKYIWVLGFETEK